MEYTQRPSGQPSERIKGRLLRWKDSDYMEFQPRQAKDTATRTMLRESKQLTYYRNEGQKENSYSLHINVAGNEQDPAATIIEKVQKELAPLTKKEVKLTAVNHYLTDTEELKVWHRKKDKKVCCYIQLDASMPVMMSGTLMRLAAEINKIINSNKF